MNFKNICVVALSLMSLFAACKKEDSPVATGDLKIPEMFSPPENADPKVKTVYSDYGVWIRMDFNDWKEVTNGILFNDQYNRAGAVKIDDDKRQDAITYAQSLLSNVPAKITKSLFPLEFFFVKSYNAPWAGRHLEALGRNRLVISWPNKMRDALPVTNPATHYYRDSVLTRTIWNYIGGMMIPRMENSSIEGFEMAGKPYDNGVVVDKIREDFLKDRDFDKRDAALLELARSGGYIEGSGSRSFSADFPNWFSLLTTESYENIKKTYLDNSERRKQKYEILIKYFNSYGWDIQATGNKYRQQLDLYK